MKKMMMMAVMVAMTTSAMAQDPVKEAKKLVGKDYQQALTTISPALTAGDAAAKAAAYNVLTDIHYQEYNRLNEIAVKSQVTHEAYDTVTMHKAAVGALEAALKCDEFDNQPDAKGKVKPKYRANHQTLLKGIGGPVVNAGLYAYQQGNSKEAQKDWMLYLDFPKSELFKGVKDMPNDPFRPDILYYAALVSYQLKDYPNAVKYAKEASAIPEKADDAAEILLFAQKETCKTQADSLEFINSLKDMRQKDPKQARYFNMLCELYSKMAKDTELAELLDDECKTNAENKMAWALKGEFLMGKEKWDEAVVAFDEAIKLDPSFLQVVFNAGACKINRARELGEQLSDPQTGNITNENLEKVKSVIRESQAYFEKSRQLDPDHMTVNWPFYLYRVYAQLGDKAKMEELEIIDPSLKSE